MGNNSDNHAKSKSQCSRNNDTKLKNPCKIYIANMPENLTKDDVMNMFRKFGKICKIFRSTEDSNKNYALLEYETELSAMDAICSLHGKPPLNLNITFGRYKNSDINTEGKDLDTLRLILKRHKINFKDNFENNDDSERTMENKLADNSNPISIPGGLLQNNYKQDDNDNSEIAMENKQANNSSRKSIPREPLQNNCQQDNQKRNCENNVDSYNGDSRDVARNSHQNNSKRPHDDFDLDHRQNKEQRVSTRYADDDSLMPPLVQICPVCQKIAHSKCMFCLTPYCSKRCQKTDWDGRHKNVCHILAAQLQLDSDSPQMGSQMGGQIGRMGGAVQLDTGLGHMRHGMNQGMAQFINQMGPDVNQMSQDVCQMVQVGASMDQQRVNQMGQQVVNQTRQPVQPNRARRQADIAWSQLDDGPGECWNAATTDGQWIWQPTNVPASDFFFMFLR